MTSVGRSQSTVYAQSSKLQQSLGLESQIASGDTNAPAPIASTAPVEKRASPQAATAGTTSALSPADLQATFRKIVGREVSDGNLTDGEGATLGQIFNAQVLGVPGEASETRAADAQDARSQDARSQDAGPQADAARASTAVPAAGTDGLAGFLKDLPSAQAQWSAYGATGATDINKKMGALLIDFKT